MAEYFWFGGVPGARTSDGYAVDAAGVRLENTVVTVKDAATGAVLTDLLDANGVPATEVTTGDLGYLTFAALVPVVDVSGGAGTFRFYSSSAVEDVLAFAPQLDDIQASAAASAYSASLSRAAAEAAVAGAKTTDASVLTSGTLSAARLPDLSGVYVQSQAAAERSGRSLYAEALARKAEPAAGVTVGALASSNTPASWTVDVGTGTWNAAADTVTTSLLHGFKVGDLVGFSDHGTVSNGVNEGLVYYVLTVVNANTFTMSQTPGGPIQQITADGTPAAHVYRNPPVREYAWTGPGVNPALRVTGGTPVAFAATMIQSDPATVTFAPGSQVGPILVTETMFEDRVDVLIRNSGVPGNINIYVDELLAKVVAPADLTAVGGVGSVARLPIVSTTAGKRHLRIEPLDRDYFPGIDRPADHPISYPSTGPKGARIMVVGDSYTEGTGAGGPDAGYVFWLKWMLGWGDVWNTGSGSTGYLEDGQRTSLVDRYQADVIAKAPDRLVIALGLNDRVRYMAGPTPVMAAVTTVWDGILSALPNIDLTIVGPFIPKGRAAYPEMVTFDGQLAAAAAARGLLYVSPVAEDWITGTGNTATPKGDGNADLYISADGTHPSPAGHKYLARRIAGHMAISA